MIQACTRAVNGDSAKISKAGGARALRLLVMSERGRVGLVLAGGGARGSYERGALSVLLPSLHERGELPSIFVGTSVGAINATSVAATSHLPVGEAISLELARWGEGDGAALIRSVFGR